MSFACSFLVWRKANQTNLVHRTELVAPEIDSLKLTLIKYRDAEVSPGWVGYPISELNRRAASGITQEGEEHQFSTQRVYRFEHEGRAVTLWNHFEPEFAITITADQLDEYFVERA